ncbi:MAG: hypothetical protein EXR66_01440 [Dehalococcoidia bacterium]|nr:hypothetical protein [Dehalococcoidia bacterium]
MDDRAGTARRRDDEDAVDRCRLDLDYEGVEVEVAECGGGDVGALPGTDVGAEAVFEATRAPPSLPLTTATSRTRRGRAASYGWAR